MRLDDFNVSSIKTAKRWGKLEYLYIVIPCGKTFVWKAYNLGSKHIQAQKLNMNRNKRCYLKCRSLLRCVGDRLK